MVDLDGDGNKTDPGWIRLAAATRAGTGPYRRSIMISLMDMTRCRADITFD